MRLKRKFIEGATYHVTSRTNDKIKVFVDNLAWKIMLMAIEEAKEKYAFTLHNFCIMPTHFHLLITPASGTSLSRIIQRIKTHSAKSLNFINGSQDHLWGERFFSRPVRNIQDYFLVHDYIDQNPIKAGLVQNAQDWEASGAYHFANGIRDFVDYVPLWQIEKVIEERADYGVIFDLFS